MAHAVTTDTQHVKFFKARDGRTVAMLVRAGFDEYGQFPPFIDTPGNSGWPSGLTIRDSDRATVAGMIHTAEVGLMFAAM